MEVKDKAVTYENANKPLNMAVQAITTYYGDLVDRFITDVWNLFNQLNSNPISPFPNYSNKQYIIERATNFLNEAISRNENSICDKLDGLISSMTDNIIKPDKQAKQLIDDKIKCLNEIWNKEKSEVISRENSLRIIYDEQFYKYIMDIERNLEDLARGYDINLHSNNALYIKEIIVQLKQELGRKMSQKANEERMNICKKLTREFKIAWICGIEENADQLVEYLKKMVNRTISKDKRKVELDICKKVHTALSNLLQELNPDYFLKNLNETGILSKDQPKSYSIQNLDEILENTKVQLKKIFDDQESKIRSSISNKLYSLLSLPNSMINNNNEINPSNLDGILEIYQNCIESAKQFEEKVIKGKGERCDDNPLDYYDTVIQADSFLSLINSGWPIYKKDHNTEPKASCVVTTIGNFGTGKSFVNTYLSGEIVPIGHNIHTIGPSCIYPRRPENPVTFLDTAGFGEPLKINLEKKKAEEYHKSSMNNQILELEEKKFDKSKIDEADIMNKKAEDILINLLKDKQYVEHFLQRFLLETSNVILVVVSQLTFADQKLINWIKKEFFVKKMIFVVHNYYNLYTIKDVKDAIKRDITDIFNVKQLTVPSEKQIDTTKQNMTYFASTESETDMSEFSHIIMAREGTEAGRYYNQSAKELILSLVKHCNQREFNLEKSLKSYVEKTIPEYLETNEIQYEIKCHSKIEKESKAWGYIQNQSQSSKLVYKKHGIDCFGFLTFYQASSEKLALPYRIMDTSSHLVIEMEIPGLTDEDLDKYNFETRPSPEGFFFMIKGVKSNPFAKGMKLQNMNIIYSNISYGDILFQTTIAGLHEQLARIEAIEAPESQYKDGIITFRWTKKQIKNKGKILRVSESRA